MKKCSSGDPTATKKDCASVVGVPALRRIVAESRLPVVAIGGIGLDQVSEVLEAGAASVAVISDLMRSQNMARRMEQFLEAAQKKK